MTGLGDVGKWCGEERGVSALADGGTDFFEREAARGIGAVGIMGGGGLLAQPISQRAFAGTEGAQALADHFACPGICTRGHLGAHERGHFIG